MAIVQCLTFLFFSFVSILMTVSIGHFWKRNLKDARIVLFIVRFIILIDGIEVAWKIADVRVPQLWNFLSTLN